MTSSLVGSEMCIRDRSFRRELPPNTPGGGHGGCGAGCPGPSYLGKAKTCLLYTSDAADDM
eukprot:149064-Prorocentrum_lima.AAC.1